MKRQYGSLTGLFILVILILLAGIIAVVVALTSDKGSSSTPETTDTVPSVSISYPPVTLEPPTSGDITAEEPTEPLTWSPKAVSDEYVSNGQTLIFSSINQPVFSGGDEAVTEKINQALAAYCRSFATIKSETKILADEDYERAFQFGNEFQPYEFASDYRSIYVRGNTLSILFQISSITGITSSSSSYESLCFDLRTGEQINLASLLGVSDDEAADYVYTVFSQVIDNNPTTYYSDVKKELSSVIDLRNFYLDENGLTLYFNAEIISPRVYGIRTFLISYQNLEQ